MSQAVDKEFRNSLAETLTASGAGQLDGDDVWVRVAWLRTAAVIAVVAFVLAVFARTKNGTVTFVATVAALISVALGAFVSASHNRKIARSYEQQLDPKGAGFVKALEERFGQAIDRFCKDIAAPIQNLSASCQTQRGKYEPWSNRAEELKEKFSALKSRIG